MLACDLYGNRVEKSAKQLSSDLSRKSILSIPSIARSPRNERDVSCVLKYDIETIVALLEFFEEFRDTIKGRELKYTNFGVLEARFVSDSYRECSLPTEKELVLSFKAQFSCRARTSYPNALRLL